MTSGLLKRRAFYPFAAYLSVVTLFMSPAARADDSVPAQWTAVYDFLVQDVCMDAAGAVKAGVFPLDPQACPTRRNLRPGERLPYHKHDWPSVKDRNNPLGLQRSDNIPVQTKNFGTVVMQARAYAGGDKSFGRLSPTRQDGDIYLLSGNSVSIAATEGPSGGIQLFYGPGCASTNAKDRVLDSWIVVDRSFSLSNPGSTVARLTFKFWECLSLNTAFTSWKVKDIEFRTSTGLRKLQTLISDHFSGTRRTGSGHLERFYYTRELGLMRWERWQNFAVRKEAIHTKRAAWLIASGACDSVHELPADDGEWAMVHCRQWTNLVPSHDPSGDPLPEWITRIRDDPRTDGLFK